jgi:hypothetical protein
LFVRHSPRGSGAAFGGMSTNIEIHSDVIVSFGIEKGALIALIVVVIAVVVTFVFFSRRHQRQ